MFCIKTCTNTGDAAFLQAVCLGGVLYRDILRATPSTSKSELSPASLYHRTECYRLLNEQLRDKYNATKDSSIMTVSLLRMLEGASGNFSAKAAHTSGLLKMLELRGGLEKLPSRLVADLYIGDVKFADIDLRPTFPLTEHWRTQFENLSAEKFRPTPDLVSIGVGIFNNDAVTKNLSPRLLKCLHALRNLYNIIDKTDSIRDTDHILFKHIEDSIITEHRLCSLPFEEDEPSALENALQECVRISALIYSNIGMWTAPPAFGITGILARRLKSGILRLDLRNSFWHGLLVWMLLMGAYISTGQHDQRWFLTKLAFLAEIKNLKEWSEVRLLLKEFFYTDEMLGKALELIWNDVRMSYQQPRTAAF
jgi:hypothetical protein